MLKSWVTFYSLFFLLISSGNNWADSTAIQHLNDNLKQIDAASADFSQHLIDVHGVRGREFRGHMQVARPGFFRWDTQEPYAQTIVADGKKVWVYDPDLNQVLIQDLDKQVGNTPALLLSSDSNTLAKAFDIVEEPAAAGQSAFLLHPRSGQALFEAMRIKFAHGFIEEMQLKDAMGQKTRIQFSQVKYHQAVDKKVFHFSIPPGADVVQQSTTTP